MANRAVFLDRDDTLIEDPGYINDPGQVKLLDGVPEALKDLKALGYKLVVVSNQSGVARGILTEKVLQRIHDRLRELLARKGACLDAIYYCPFHPNGAVPKYRKESDWRKPSPGMLVAAAKDFDINLAESWLIGDDSRDIEAGFRAGCKTIFVDNPAHSKYTEQLNPRPDYKSINLREAVNIIKMNLRSQNKPLLERPPMPAPAAAQQPNTVVQNPQPQPIVQSTPPQPHEKDAESPELTPAPEYFAIPQPQPEEEQEPDLPCSQASPLPLPEPPADSSQKMLADIFEKVKSIERAEMFGDFSIMRLLAGIVQIVVVFCLLIGLSMLLNPNSQPGTVLITLGFATVLQIMALTFYLMHTRK